METLVHHTLLLENSAVREIKKADYNDKKYHRIGV